MCKASRLFNMLIFILITIINVSKGSTSKALRRATKNCLEYTGVPTTMKILKTSPLPRYFEVYN